MRNKAVEIIANLCPDIQSLCISQLDLVHPDEMLLLAISCTKLHTVYLRSHTSPEQIPSLTAFIQNCPFSLQIVQLWQMPLDGPAMVAMARRCPHLTELWIPHCTLSDVYFVECLQYCRALRVLNAYICRWFNNQCVLALAACPQLHTLRCGFSSHLNSDAIAAVLEHLPNMQTLDVWGSALHFDCSVVLRALATHCPGLKSLIVRASKIQQFDLDHFTAKCTQLTNLQLRVTFGERVCAFNCTHLQHLEELHLMCLKKLDHNIMQHAVTSCPKLQKLVIYAVGCTLTVCTYDGGQLSSLVIFLH